MRNEEKTMAVCIIEKDLTVEQVISICRHLSCNSASDSGKYVFWQREQVVRSPRNELD